MLSETVLAKSDSRNIRVDPFPHLVIEDALDPEICRQLIATRPEYPGDASAENVRLPIPAWMLMSLEFYSAPWRDFARNHADPQISCRVEELFADHWPETLPRPTREGSRFGVIGRENFDQADILTDARLEIISPVRDRPGSHRGAHLDTPNRLFSALFYLRAPEDDSTGGGLDLYRYLDRAPEGLDAFEFADDLVECAVTVPYRANTLVVFPNSAQAIHGSQIRDVTSHDRAYVFITAEFEHDLF